MIGRTISHYRIESKLGEGGMGVVYKAEDITLRRPVALKFLPSKLLGDEEARARFLREARAAAALQHPNICTVYEIAEAEGHTFIAMAYIDGVELGKRIQSGPISVDGLLETAIQIAAGLQEAHGKGIVHRDIKPANIIETTSGRAVLMDFGLARLGAAESKLTKDGATVGTSSYMSPEQTSGAALDHRTDIWALGVVLYEMATGQLPFRGHYEQAVLYSILNESPEPITAVRSGAPAELERIINKCLAKTAEDRYQTAADLVADLNALKRHLQSGQVERSKDVKENEVPSIAVLPFENRSHGDEDEYFSDGISEDIISALGKVDGLRVTPRSLAFQFKGKRPLPDEVGRTLNVQHILEGTVRRAGERVRINVELIVINGRYQLWSERYDRVMDDIFEIQDEISQAIVEQLRGTLVGNKQEVRNRRYTENVKAYNLCLRGRHAWHQSARRAMDFFEQALGEDPNYAIAHSGLADCYSSLVLFGVMSAREASLHAEVAARRALEIDSELASAHASLGMVKAIFDWDWPSAEREFERSFELDRNYAMGRFWYATWVLVPQGRLEEALAEFRRAAELDPVSPLISCAAGMALVQDRQFDRAIEHLEACLPLDPKFYHTHFILGMAYLNKGDYDKAIASFQRGNLQHFQDGYLGYAYAASGETQKAREIVEALNAGSQPDHLTPFLLAIAHLGLGEKDEALRRLSQVCDIRAPSLGVIGHAAEFDSVRDDPRFQAILRRMNLAD